MPIKQQTYDSENIKAYVHPTDLSSSLSNDPVSWLESEENEQEGTRDAGWTDKRFRKKRH